MTTIKTTMLILALAASFVFTSCGGNYGPATPITAEQFQALDQNKENAGKRFSITGYPYLSDKHDIIIGRDMEIAVGIYNEPKGEGEYIGSIRMDYKMYENGMYIPDSYTPDDLQIYDNEGNQLGVNDKITVSFTMELDTDREPRKGHSTKMEKDENGIPRLVDGPPVYYGEGPVDIVIDKAK